MVRSRAELQRLVTEVSRHPRQVVLECSCRHARLTPKFPFVRQIVESGEIGHVYYVHHNHLTRSTFIEYNPRGAWAHSRKQAGGPLFDQGVYDLSFHLGVLGDKPEFSRVRSFKRGGLKVFRDRAFFSDVEEHAAAFLEFRDGLTYYYERAAGAHMDVSNQTRFCGTKGAIRLAYYSWDAPQIEVFTVDRRRRERRQVRKVSMRGHVDDNLALTGHFLDCVLDGARPQMPVSLAAKHLEILFRIHESSSRT
jgi:predicted dehydrogenase